MKKKVLVNKTKSLVNKKKKLSTIHQKRKHSIDKSKEDN